MNQSTTNHRQPAARASLDAMTAVLADELPDTVTTPPTPITTVRRVGIVLNANPDPSPVFAKASANVKAMAAKAAGNRVRVGSGRTPVGKHQAGK